jgi:hypothetical protein
MLCCAWEGYV